MPAEPVSRRRMAVLSCEFMFGSFFSAPRFHITPPLAESLHVLVESLHVVSASSSVNGPVPLQIELLKHQSPTLLATPHRKNSLTASLDQLPLAAGHFQDGIAGRFRCRVTRGDPPELAQHKSSNFSPVITLHCHSRLQAVVSDLLSVLAKPGGIVPDKDLAFSVFGRNEREGSIRRVNAFNGAARRVFPRRQGLAIEREGQPSNQQKRSEQSTLMR
jgi:hypothetical protein